MLMIIRAATNSVGAQRRDQQVAEVARVHLLEERDREAELSAEQDVPQQHGADEDAAGLREEARLLGDVGLQEAPHQHLHRRPVDQLDQPRRRTSAADTNSAAPSRRCGAARSDDAAFIARASRCAPARDVEEHLLQRVAAVAREQAGRRVVVLDVALLHEDHALAQALDLGHVVRGDQQGRAALVAIALEPRRAPSRRCRDRARRSARRAAAGPGALISALASETRVFCPADSLPVGRSSRSVSSSCAAISSMRSVEIVDAVEHAEHREVLPDGEPHRHLDIGALEIHPVQHAVALARHLGAEHPHRAGGRHHQPHQHRDGGGLAGAVAAEQAGDRAGRQRERNAVDRGRGLVDLDQAVGANGGLGTGIHGLVRARCRHI